MGQQYCKDDDYTNHCVIDTVTEMACTQTMSVFGSSNGWQTVSQEFL